MGERKMISVLFILFLATSVIAYIFDPHNVFPGKVDDILVCICGLIAIRNYCRIGFRTEEDD